MPNFLTNPTIKFKKRYKNNQYVVFLKLTDEIEMTIFYHRSMINIDLLQKSMIPSLLVKSRISPNLETLDIPGITVIEEQDIDSRIFGGSVIIYNHKNKKIYALGIENIPTRQTSDPITDISISGPRDALVESNDKNVALIQKRIKTNKLTIDKYTVGELTNTDISLLYIEEEANPKLVNNIKEKIQKAKLKSLTNIGQLQSLLTDKKSFIPLLNYTSRPDFISESLLKGRIIIMMDGIPLSLIAPATFFYFLDYHDSLSENYFSVLFDRLLFAISFFLAVFVAPFIMAVISFYPEFLPLPLIASTINARKGITYSFINEIIIAEILFQIFRIAGTRLSQSMSASLLVVGSLLLGRAVIEAGILSQEALFVASISVIASYVISNNSSFNTSVNLIRWFLFISTALYGFIGMSIGFLLIIIYLVSRNSIETPYLYPLAPLNPKALFESILPTNFLRKKENKRGENK